MEAQSDKQDKRDPSTGRFVRGHKGGTGRPRGSVSVKNKSEYMEMLEARTPEVLKVLLDKAVEGDMQAIKVVMDRVLPIATLQVIELAE